MTTMTLTANSYADLMPFEALARERGVSVEVEPDNCAALKGPTERSDNAAIRDAIIRNARRSGAEAFREFQISMEGAALEAGFTCEQDVVDYCKKIRREMWEERYESNV